jgi:hypothetical protein
MTGQVMMPMQTDDYYIVTTHPKYRNAAEVPLEEMGTGGGYGWWVIATRETAEQDWAAQ